MDTFDSLAVAQQHLADEVVYASAPSVKPLRVSPWVAMSLLQKSIRRGHEDLALRAAATLLETDPVRLWRRCCGIAFEDVGNADIDTVALVTASMAGKKFRAQLGGEWQVASYVVSRMTRALKCRAADDLLMIAELHPRFERARSDFATLSTPELLDMATGALSLPERAIAAWYAAGTFWRTTRQLRPRRGESQLLFDHLKGWGYPSVTVDLAREGFRRGADMLAPFVAMLSPLHQAPTVAEHDQFPPETMIGDVPGWALDIYSREGRASLDAFLCSDSPTATWVRAEIPPAQRLRFLGGVLFRVKGGLARQRLRWRVGHELRKTMDVECHGRHCADASQVMELMRADIPLLNRVRAHV